MEGVARENDLNQAVEVRKADAFEAVFADQEFADEFGNRRPALTSSVLDDVELHFFDVYSRNSFQQLMQG